jgi:hypothetical protein
MQTQPLKNTVHLFIDTNIWLSLYHFTHDDLEQLSKVVVLIDQRKLTLHQPSPVVDEFWRNRDSKISDALKKFKAAAALNEFPQMCKDYPQFGRLVAAAQEYQRLKAHLLDQLERDAVSESLAADKVISGLFAKANLLKTTPDVIGPARLRIEVGNPPGKKGSLGDALNWESLLRNVPEGEDLYLVADDQDYRGSLNDVDLHPYLAREWKSKGKQRHLLSSPDRFLQSSISECRPRFRERQGPPNCGAHEQSKFC